MADCPEDVKPRRRVAARAIRPSPSRLGGAGTPRVVGTLHRDLDENGEGETMEMPRFPRRACTGTARSVACLLLLVAAVLGPALPAGGQVRWRSTEPRLLPQLTPAGAARAIGAMVEPGARRHVVVQFADPVGPDVRNRMQASGVRLLAYLGDNAFFAVVDEPRLREAGLAQVRSLRSATAIERNFKLHPMLAAGALPQWAAVGPVTLSSGEPDTIVGAYVLFHRDVSLADATLLALAYGAVVRDELESINCLVIELPFSRIGPLADLDAVQWIEPPLPRLSDVNDSNRVVTEADVVQAPPFNLDGSGVTVLVYDGGTARASHDDFGGRLSVHDGSGLADHATHVSGTVGGDGSASGGTFRGMAPGVNILSYGFQYDGSGIFLYTNPGDMENDYSEAINTLGADLSNNSIGTNTAINGFPCEITGDYGITSVLIDTIVRGDSSNPLFNTPFRIIWSNGNERQTPNCGDLYFTTAPPACAKNHITIGALNSNDDSMTGFSSWGPTDDGRIKPDVSAPGCQSNGDNGVTSTSSASDTAYSVKCGTSMSGPTVAGLTALLLEDFRSQFPAQPDPRNSTVKALLANTAQDNGNPGPDYQFGYGSVRIEATIDLLRSGGFLEGSITQGETQFFQVQVDPGTPELRVTLAWDDVPGTPNVDPALVNDVDLLISGPGGSFFPWTLNPGDPGANAIQSQPDHVNNIEQVLILNPTPGRWTIEVSGFDVPSGPQPFSLAGASLTNNGLFIGLPGGTPDLIEPGVPTDIDVLITAAGESLVPGSPQLSYRFDGGTFQTAAMVLQGGDLYRATLPAAACTDLPEFFFSAEGTASGVVSNPADAPSTTYTASVGTISLVFADDFESNQGWTTENLGATTGDWQRGVPVDDPGWDYDPTSDGDGSGQAFLTQNELGNTDVDNGAVRLVSPVIDMSGGSVTISYEFYLRLTDPQSTDRLLVEISSNGDAGPWTTIADHDTDGGLTWRHHDVTQADLDAAGVSLTSNMKVRFTANDDDPQSINESGVDGFEVRTVGCSAGLCGNGVVDPGEDCATCPQDVPCDPGEECVSGVCAPLCGNGVVDPGEDCDTCPQDVQCAADEECIGGVCVPLCGNGVVDPGEDCATCPADVSCGVDEECVGGVCQPLCGNGVVDPGEDCLTCPQDVQCAADEECIGGVCVPLCGNGVVDPGEDCLNCPQDVGCPPGEECVGGICQPLCGNGVVDPGEDCLNCPQDVGCPPGQECVGGVCVPLCGNGVVDPGEDCLNCPQDVGCPPGEECVVGVCVSLCGNGVVDPGEDCATCPQDVPCPPGEECVGGVCVPLCGNGVVDPGEDCATCPQDVPCPPGEECVGGMCVPLCGNGVVDPGEDCATCPQDVPCPPGEECVGGVCVPLCGNGVVDPGEDCATCPQDVPCPPGEECVGGVCVPLCGNGVVDPGEDCLNCPQDVGCPPGEECVGGICQPLCGNGVVDPGEDCATCPQDVPCPPGEECVGGICQPLCGNGVVDPGEDCLNCPQDVGCPPGEECVGGVCVPLCGNGVVDPGEDCATCPQDVPCPPGQECVAGICQPLCGNGVVDPGEDCLNCPQDVGCPPGEECVGGICQPLCGNGVVDPGEDCLNCPQDVGCPPGEECLGGICVPLCGNGVVDPGEDCATCPADVPCPPDSECVNGMCELLCGNGVVDPGEDCANCPQDVQCPPGSECVNGMCELLCGNGVVDPGEDCTNCPQDVQCPPGTECIAGMCEPLCGNGVADPGEDCANCPADVQCPLGEECVAGVCQPLCGNGVTDPGEDCASCPQDVPCPPGEECVGGVCQPLCGNGVVDPGEDCANCPQDVGCPPDEECVGGICQPLCGNGAVDPGEDCSTCPQDVACPPGTECDGGVCVDLCGNGVVDPGEDCSTCPADVPCPAGTECVAGMCEALCGNGVVDPGEDCANCPQDVGCAADEECVGGICQPLCGNGVVDPGEDCSTCPQDVPCPPGTTCAAGVCEADCPEDVNGDGSINVLDLIDLLLCFGLPAAPGCEVEDVNEDGTVNVLDLIDLLLLFGTTCP